MRELLKRPDDTGEELLGYWAGGPGDEGQSWHDVTSSEINGYLKEISDDPFDREVLLDRLLEKLFGPRRPGCRVEMFLLDCGVHGEMVGDLLEKLAPGFSVGLLDPVEQRFHFLVL